MKRWFGVFLMAAAGLLTAAGACLRVAAAPPDLALGEDLLPLPTLGGMQFWADEQFYLEWHIQRHATTNEYRLLDGNNLRHASGTLVQCRAALEKAKRELKLPPMQGKAVIVLHGLARSRSNMEALCRYLRQQGGYTVFNVGYPSTRDDIAQHAQSLARVIENLSGIEEIHLVAHSMGNIVIRHYLGDQTDPASGRKPDPRIRRMVMLGPPNRGSVAALALSQNELFDAVAGKSGQQLGRDWIELRSKLATPQCEFGIIAGGKSDNAGFNPLLPGDDDGIATVSSTRLVGAADFVVVPVFHTLLVDDATVMEYTLRFLQNGYFISAERRCPIVADADKPAGDGK